MNFADSVRKETNKTYTENGASALKSTGDKCLDFFSTVGALRNTTDLRKYTIYDAAYYEDPLIATKILFYARDAREGLGERQTFRELLNYAANYYPETIRYNIPLIPFYGRWDDLYFLVGTPLENDMWTVVHSQLIMDLQALKEKRYKDISLCAKWLKTPDASSEATKKLGIYTAKALHMEVYHYKRMLRRLRKAINIVEVKMSAGEWDEINYSAVPSKAMTNYRNAFQRHDAERFNDFTGRAVRGEVKINSSTLFPYDIIEKYHIIEDWRTDSYTVNVEGSADVLEAQWRQLPNYVEPGTNAIVIADTSGSMQGRPMDTALGLAIYFAQHNTGAYHNLWMNFSSDPSFQQIRGATLKEILSNIDYSNWSSSTNCKAAFDLILDIAVSNNVSRDEMPKSIIIISDMEFDSCGGYDWTFYDTIKRDYERHEYQIPNVIFWNVNSRHDVFHTDSTRKGVQLVSGQSVAVFKELVGSIGLTPVEMMLKVINSDRYKEIKIHV